jgi:uncharacterized membrane protein
MSWGFAFRLRRRLKESLWVVPFLGAVLGALLAQLVRWLDQTVQVPPAWQYSASTATGVLSVLVGAMVALLGFVVTIGVLVVQQATGTLSPRFMRLWYRDLLQKLVLATFAGTLTFSFSLLRHVEQGSVPNIGVTVAGGAVAVSMLLLLLYLNRFTHMLRPVAVAAIVASAGRVVVESSPVQAVAPEELDDAMRKVLSAERSLMLRVTRPGALQAVNVEGLVAVARRFDCVLLLHYSVGDFVPTGASIAEVLGPGPFPRTRRLCRMFAFGQERTIEQDPAFALRILVDIAIRALSPAVNDPTTAVQVLDYIEDLLLAMGRRRAPGCGEFRDADGRPRLLVPTRRWEDLLELGVTEIRRYGASAVQVNRRLRAALEQLHRGVLPEHRAAIEVQLRKLDASVAECFDADADLGLADASDRQGIGGPPVVPGDRFIPSG